MSTNVPKIKEPELAQSMSISGAGSLGNYNPYPLLKDTRNLSLSITNNLNNKEEYYVTVSFSSEKDGVFNSGSNSFKVTKEFADNADILKLLVEHVPFLTQ